MSDDSKRRYAEAGRRLLDEWTGRLGQALEAMVGQAPTVEWKPGSPSPLGAAEADMASRAGDVLWWEQGFSVLPEARFWAGVPQQSWTGLGTRILTAAGIDEPAEAEARSTFLELLGQSLASLANAMGGWLGMEVTCAAGGERPGSAPEAENWFRVELVLGDMSVSLLAAIGEPLLAVVSARSSGAGGGEQVPEAPQPIDAPDSRMLELLLDVELPVSVSFGRTQLALKETLKLTTGSIVELNRAISEPVEVVVNNCVIARGEVVVIEGNYGVRIKEIMSRQDRIRHLR